ncbi:type I secretion system permease/ATPase [bacterium]|nr:type I secretion system permease/ATPase [bacterium]MBU1994275.1 type I secretion system permease/ATPase [bacterium]
MKRKAIENPLLEILVLFTRNYHKPFTKEHLVNGLPASPDKMYPELYSESNPKSLFFRAAHQAGLKSKLIIKDLQSVSQLVLPVILILKKKQACILTEIDNKSAMAEIIFPNGKTQVVKLESLERAYTGKLFLIKKSIMNKFIPIKEKTDRGHWFWDIFMLSRSIYVDAVIASLLINIFVLATPLFIMNVYDRVIPNNSFDTLWMFSIGLLVIYFFEAIVAMLRTSFLELSAKKTDVIISSEIFQQILDMRMIDLPKSTGAFSSTIKDFDYLRNFLANTSMIVLVDLPFLFLFLFVMYFIAGNVVFVPIVTLMIMAVYIFFKRRSLKSLISQTRNANAYKQGILVENINALETVKSLNLQKNAQFEWEEATGEGAQQSYAYKTMIASMETIIKALTHINTVAIIIAGVYLISINEMTTGGLIAFILLSRRSIAPLGKLSGIAQGYYQAKTSYALIDRLMGIDIEHPENREFIQKEQFEGKIEFRDVNFHYQNDNKEALSNVSFTIHPGEKVAFLGEMGSGKTTALKLILNLYAPTSGAVYIDDLDINQINPSNLRNNIGYVSQEIVLLSGTLKENILAKNPNATSSQIIRACEYSGVDKIIKQHPMGLDMLIHERGSNLSSGQRQSIGIARVLLSDYPIYLFDEPTSSIDSTHEKHLIESLQSATSKSTVVVITHRKAILSLVERIIVFNNGKVYADGPKEEILKMME